MGVDLRLLPLDSLIAKDGNPPWGFSHTILNVPRSRECWDAVDALNPRELPAGHDISSLVGGIVESGDNEGEHTYGTLKEDAYGNAYTWIEAGALGEVLAKFFPTHPVTAYIRAMKPAMLVVLDWH